MWKGSVGSPGVGSLAGKFNPLGSRSAKNVFGEKGGGGTQSSSSSSSSGGLAALEEEEADELGMSRLDDELAQFTARAFDADGYANAFFEEHPFIEVREVVQACGCA